MGTLATGAYLWTLRESQRMTRSQVADYIQEKTGSATNESQVMKIEKGQQDTRASVLIAFLECVGGNPRDLINLMLDRNTTDKDGTELARRWLSGDQINDIDDLISQLPPSELKAILDDIIDEVNKDPGFIQLLKGLFLWKRYQSGSK